MWFPCWLNFYTFLETIILIIYFILCGTVCHTITVQQKGSWVLIPFGWGLSVWTLHVLLMYAWVSSRFYSFCHQLSH